MEKKIDFIKLYEEIYRILSSGNLQDLMNVCYEQTGIPILIVDILYNLLGIAPQVPTGEYLWDYLLEHRVYDAEKVTLMMEDGILQSVDVNSAPYIVDWGSQKDHPKIQGIVRINGAVEAYVTMNCTNIPITEDKLKAMEIIQNVCAFFFKGSSSEGNMQYTYQKVFLKELLHGNVKTNKDLRNWFINMNFEPKPPYVITAITAPEKNGKLALSLLRKSCQPLSSQHLILIQDNIVYTFYYGNNPFEKNRLFEISLNDILHRFQAHIGVSAPFYDLLDFSDFKLQADTALNIGMELHPAKNQYHYTDYQLPALLFSQVKNSPQSSYVPHILIEIKQYDDKNSTKFLLTLQSYIFNLKNTAETAKELHIHRNTLLYRLNKIEELFSLSLSDYRTVLLLMNAFYMLDLDKELHKNNTPE